MKITVGQLKQLIREQVEEMAARKPYSGAFSDEMMLASLGDEEGEFDKEFWEEEWADWVQRNKDKLKAVLRTKLNTKRMDMATALKKAKKVFFKKASYDPDFLPYYQDVDDLLPEFKVKREY